VELGQRIEWNAPLVLEGIKQLSQRLGRTPTYKVDTKLGQAALRYFGSWNEAVKAAGLTPNVSYGYILKNPRIPKLCPSLAWFVMFLKGDGYVPKGKAFVSIGLKEELNGALYRKLKRIVKRLFGLPLRHYKYRRYLIMNIYSVKLNRWLHENYGKFGTFVWDVPSSILHSNDKSILRAALRGIFDAEGAVSLKAGQVSMSSINLKALEQVRLLLQKVGIKSSINGRILTISGCVNIKKFYEQIGFTVTFRQKKLEKLVNRYMNGHNCYYFIDWKHYGRLWLKGEKSAKEIAKEINSAYGTVFRHLREIISATDYEKASKLWRSEAGRRNLKNAKLHNVNLEPYVKQWLALEKSMCEIAKELGVSQQSIRYHFRRMIPRQKYWEILKKWKHHLKPQSSFGNL
jgi:DNA-binding CsgD family transcriptional regulator